MQRRLPKFLRLGLSDVQTAQVIAPWGVDSNPIKDAIGAFSETGERGAPVILGYINKSKMEEAGTEQHAAIGELRLYSTNSAGVQKIYIWLKNDGTIELGGATRSAVKYEELEDGFNTLRSDFNALVTLFNAHTHIASSFGSPTTPPPTPANPSTADISAAKSTIVKL